jgi:hypothetical protein
MYTNLYISDTLSQAERDLVTNARRIPAVLYHNGVRIGDDLVLRCKQFERTLFAGVLNYWFLRDWASWSLGRDCPEVVDLLPGSGLLFRSYPAHYGKAIPFYDAKIMSFGRQVPMTFRHPDQCSVDGVERNGSDLDREMLAEPPGFGGVWADWDFEDPNRHQVPLPKFSAYKFFASHAYFDGPVLLNIWKNRMPLLDIPLEPYEVIRGRVVYRRSVMEKRFPEQFLRDSGYIFRLVGGILYYTNSVACFHGLPPVAEALGWPKLLLSADSLPDKLSG